MSCEPRRRHEIEAEQPLFHVSVRAPGHPSSISPVVQSLLEVVRESECAVGKEFEIEIALREALANAVVHGCANDSSKIVECELACRAAGDLVIVVRDPGPGFDPASIVSPVTGENVYATHGRGIYLITQLMDEAWFELGGREIHMVLRSLSSLPGKVSSERRAPGRKTLDKHRAAKKYAGRNVGSCGRRPYPRTGSGARDRL